jgi:transposase-like protein
MADVRAMSFLAIGRKYGVSDNAVRKWLRWYQAGEPCRRADDAEDPDDAAA